MIDVDHFKQINDVHGHAVGDRVLADLAQSCREHVRPDDIAGRYGGDEFIIMVPGISSLRAIQIAARLTGPPARVTGSDGKPVTFTRQRRDRGMRGLRGPAEPCWPGPTWPCTRPSEPGEDAGAPSEIPNVRRIQPCRPCNRPLATRRDAGPALDRCVQPDVSGRRDPGGSG